MNFVSDSDAEPGYVKVCDDSAIRLIKVTTEDMMLFVVSAFFLLALPVYLYFFKNEHELLLPLILPYVDPDTRDGFILNCTHQLILASVGICGMLGVEFEKQICKNAVWVQSVVTCYQLDEMDVYLKQETKHEYEIKMRLRDVLAKTRDFDVYINEWSRLFYWSFFLQPICLIASVSIALFLFIVVDISPFYYQNCIKTNLKLFISRIIIRKAFALRSPFIQCCLLFAD